MPWGGLLRRLLRSKQRHKIQFDQRIVPNLEMRSENMQRQGNRHISSLLPLIFRDLSAIAFVAATREQGRAMLSALELMRTMNGKGYQAPVAG